MTVETKISPPELFNDPKNVALRQGEQLKPIRIEITPDGVYAGNGQFQDPKSTIFQIIGFDRTNGREFWLGRAYIKTTQLS